MPVKCSFCQTEIDPVVAVCPQCGTKRVPWKRTTQTQLPTVPPGNTPTPSGRRDSFGFSSSPSSASLPQNRPATSTSHPAQTGGQRDAFGFTAPASSTPLPQARPGTSTSFNAQPPHQPGSGVQRPGTQIRSQIPEGEYSPFKRPGTSPYIPAQQPPAGTQFNRAAPKPKSSSWLAITLLVLMILGAAGYGFWQWRQINEENKQTKQVASPTRNSVVVIDPTPRLIAPLEFTIPDQPYRMIVSYHNTTHVYEMKPGPNTFSMGDVKIDLPPTAEHPWPVDPYRSVTRSGMMMLYFNLNGMPTPDVAEKINPQFQYAMLSPNYLRPDRFHIPEVDYVVELYHDGQISSKFVNANAPHPQLSIGPYEFCLDPQCAASWPVPPRLYFDDKTMAPHFFFNLDQAEAQYFLDQNAGKTLLDPVVHSNLRTKPKPALVSTTATPPSTVRLSGRELYDRCKGSVAVLRTSDGSQGSGFIGPDRMLITNAHVVSGAEWIDVHFPGGEKFRAKKFRGVSALWDLAAIKLPDSITLPELPVGGTANIGDTVYALGTPRGMEFTLSRGVISQKRRVLNNIEMIQTDASVSPGSSGGPLINEMGQVIGVTSMGSNAALQANNLNFAVSDLMVTQFLKSNREESDHDLNRTTYDTQRLVTAVGSSSADAPEPAGSPLPNTKSVTSSDHNVTVQLPKGWMAIKGKTPLNLVYANQDGKPIVAAQLFVAPVLTRDLDEFYRQRMELFGYLSDDVIRAIKSCETVQVSGVPAKRTTYTRGENTILLEFLLIKSGQGYSFLFLVQADEYHQLERQLDQLVKTAAIR